MSDIVSIRKATEVDLTDMMALYFDFHNFHALHIPTRLAYINPSDDPELLSAILKILNDNQAVLLVAILDGELIGLAEAYIKQASESPAVVQRKYALLQSLMIMERKRNLGVGKLLVQAVELWAREHGISEMETEVWIFSKGPLAFYEGLGYSTFKQRLSKSL